MSGPGRPLDLAGRVRGQWQVALTTLLVLVAAIVAFVQVLIIVRSWQLAGADQGFASEGGEPISRLDAMAQYLIYGPLQMGSMDLVAGAVPAAVAFALVAHRADSDAADPSEDSEGWRRLAWLATVLAAVLGLLAALARTFVHVSWLVSMNDAFEVFGPEDTAFSAIRLLGALTEALLWVAALILGVLWRPVAPERDSDDDVGRPGDEPDLAREREVREPAEERVVPPAAPATAYARPAEPDPAPGPRLEEDGSSDTGYDEFRFRR